MHFVVKCPSVRYVRWRFVCPPSHFVSSNPPLGPHTSTWVTQHDIVKQALHTTSLKKSFFPVLHLSEKPGFTSWLSTDTPGDTGDLGQLFQEETDDALHLINPLDVPWRNPRYEKNTFFVWLIPGGTCPKIKTIDQALFVWTMHISDIHVLKLHLGVLACKNSKNVLITPSREFGMTSLTIVLFKKTSHLDFVRATSMAPAYKINELTCAVNWHHQCAMFHGL